MNADQQIDPRDPDAVCKTLRSAGEASLGALCRRASCDCISAPGRLIASGDLHDNPFTMDALVKAADLNGPDPAHLTLHELIHPEHLPVGGADFSYRALVRAAALKIAHPEHVHVLLANHQLSQIVGAGIVKNGVRVVEAFDDGLDLAFGDRAEDVADAIDAFVRALPLALRAETAGGPGADVLCAHSLPGRALFDRFDPDILDRPLETEDYEPRRGSAHLMVWGRGHEPELLTELAERWGVAMFVLGHEEAPGGVLYREPNTIILNSHDQGSGAFLDLDLGMRPDAPHAALRAERLA